MPSALVIPGVQVRTVFEPSPALPSLTGVLGVVGVTDRGPLTPTPVGSMSEFLELFGPGSRYTLPEVKTAFANGVSLLYVARTAPGRGQKARLTVLDDDGEPVVTFIARAEGAWGNQIGIRATQVKTLSGRGVKYVNLDVFLRDQLVESHTALTTDETSPSYLFDRINSQSRLIVAVDPEFEAGLPAVTAARPLADAPARPAFTTLKSGAADVLRVEAKLAGARGNLISIRVREGQASLPLPGAANAPSVELRARQEGAQGTAIRISVVAAGSNVQLVVTPAAGAPRTLGPFSDVNAVVEGLKTDPDLLAIPRGTVLPAPLAAPTPLLRRVQIEVIAEGRDSGVYSQLSDLDAIAAINDPLVTFAVVGGASTLPDTDPGHPLRGGREAGPALELVGDTSPEPLLELYSPTPLAEPLSIAVSRGISDLDQSTAVIRLDVIADGVVESHPNLTMDPDDPRYLPVVLESASTLRARDLVLRSRTSALPAHMVRARRLAGGISPSIEDYSDALERLEGAEEVDMVIASVAHQLTDTDVRAVHRQVVAHCSKMADLARNRIGIGSPSSSESSSTTTVIDHADDVRSDHFILAAPAGMEGALAGLLARQNFWDSPTFKTVAAPDAPVGQYTDAQLTQLLLGNVLVVNEKRRLGTIVVKGLLTSGRQINVQRTANKAVRDVKAICDRYIGLLNNDGSRNALRQQITAMLLQMERDGALVPSTDGKDPAFVVNVFSTQSDFASGIVRVDLALRPVRAIDYIYATILVKN